MSGEHGHPEIPALDLALAQAFERLARAEASQAASDNVVRSLLARLAAVEAGVVKDRG